MSGERWNKIGSDDLFKKRRDDRQKRKHDFRQPKANSFLIVTEGKMTEPLYFSGIKKKIEGKIGASLGGFLGGGVAITDTDGSTRNLSQSDLTSFMTIYNSKNSTGKGLNKNSSFSKAQAEMHNASDQKAFRQAYGETNSTNVSKAASDVISANKQFSEVSSLSRSQNASYSMTSFMAASQIDDNEFNVLKQKARNESTFGEVERQINDRAEQLQADGLGNKEMCQKAAYFEYYADKGDAETFGMLGETYTKNSVSRDATKYSDIKGPNTQEIKQEVNRQANGNMGAMSNNEQYLENKYQNQREDTIDDNVRGYAKTDDSNNPELDPINYESANSVEEIVNDSQKGNASAVQEASNKDNERNNEIVHKPLTTIGKGYKKADQTYYKIWKDFTE